MDREVLHIGLGIEYDVKFSDTESVDLFSFQ